jgi:ribosome maturation factor RimP
MSVEKRIIEFLVEVQMNGGGMLSILIDGDNGVAIADCVAVSRHVGFYLEEENAIEQAYNLEVSSPGLDTPLRSLRQYQKNINRSLSVKLNDGNKREGKLISAEETGITIEENIKEKGKKATLVESFIPFNEITETKVLVSFK